MYISKAADAGGPGCLGVLFAMLLLAAPGVRAQTVARHQADSDSRSSAVPGPVDTTNAGGSTEAPTYGFVAEGTAVVKPGDHYDASPLWTFFFGGDYRQVWDTPVQVPVIDLERTAGGLTPVERGGGLQTTSLHLRGDDGHQYVLRSVDKDAARSLPEGFRGTFVADIARDQTASLNPYAAFVLPKLATEAGVLHTMPRLVVVPDSPRLGPFREDYAGMLALFERKPDEDQSDAPWFGRSENIVGSEKLFEKIEEDNDDRVDERAYARARLFDMLVGDWDRHDDQWRWAEFEGEYGTRFVAVPRDRDFAFVRYDGLLLRLIRQTGDVRLRKLVRFDDEVGDLVGLNWQGAKLDLRLTSSLSREDWVDLAEEIRASVTDEVIAAAVREWPEPVFAEIGPETIETLKARRDRLPKTAAAYYEMLAQTVDVVGTDKHERFEVARIDDDEMQVVVYKTKKEGDVVRELYRRTFRPGETKEVRLYGLGGNDQFIVEGNAADGIRLRAIGGEGEDRFVDDTGERRAAALNHFYDTAEESTWEVRPQTKVHRSHDPAINRYEMHRFEFDTTVPLLALDYDSDDGLFVGGGLRMERQGFRKEPYAAAHEIEANYAPRSRAYNVRYEGDFRQLWRGWNARVEADVLTANHYRNFYGLGNETPEGNRERYLAHLRWATVAPMLYREIGDRVVAGAGPYFQYTAVEPPEGRSAGDPQVAYTPEQLTDKYFTGLRASVVVDTRDDRHNPRLGLRWAGEAGVHVGVRHADQQFVRLASELGYYLTLPTARQTTLALRAGGATNLGDFAFFQANTVGGEASLRGYARNRFAGHSSAYANAELRQELGDVNVYLTRGTLGVLGFADTGRVWADGPSSRLWHVGYGGGLWFTPFNLALVTATVGFSAEHPLADPIFDLSLGFAF